MKILFGTRSGIQIDDTHMSEQEFELSSQSWFSEEREHQWESALDQFGNQIPTDVGLSIWLELLMDAMGSSAYRYGFAGGTRKHPGLRICFATTDTYLSLQYDASKARYRASVRGDQNSDQSESTIKWKDAITRSLRRFGESLGEIHWAAAIGPFEPYNRTPEAIGKLSTSGRVGNLRLEVTPTHQQECFPSQALLSFKSLSTWLIKVSGISAIPIMAEKEAAENLRRLCVVLAIATRRFWVVRTPIEVGVGDWNPTITAEDGSELFQEEFQLEPWMTAAYEQLHRDEKYSDAASVFHEGIGLLGEHPSIAQVALIASIETLAEREFGQLERCEECKAISGIGRRFKQMLLTVLEPEKAERLARAYEGRSRTVHSGALHGHESAVSLIGEVQSPFDSGVDFYFEVWDLCVAASELLRRAITTPSLDGVR